MLGDQRAGWRPDTFSEELWGCEHRFRFPIAKLIDWRGREAELASSENPFALVVLAHLATQETAGEAERVRALCRFIDWLLTLPPAQAAAFDTEITAIEKELHVSYVPTYERKALQQGLRQGRAEVLRSLFSIRFGELPATLRERIERADPAAIEQLQGLVITATSLEEIARILG